MIPARLLPFTLLPAVALVSTIASAQTPTFSRNDLQTGVTLTERVIAGDFTSDGAPDLVVASHSLTQNYGIYLLRGRGDGTFDAPVLVLAPPAGTSLGAADVNNDGRLDLVFQMIDQVWTLPGRGDGTFGAALVSPAAFSSGPPVLVDVNHDGKLDLVAANQDDGVSVSLGNGDGTFAAPALLPLDARIARVAAGDVDGDGNVDLLAANIGLPDAFDGAVVTVLFGAGDGTFGRREDVPVGPTPQSLAALDANGDGHLDIAASSYAAPTLSVAINKGDGTFLPSASYPTAGMFNADTAAADVNGDGRPDVAVCGATPVLSIFTNAGGTFAGRTDVPAASSCSSIAAADFNLDGKPDFAVNYDAGSGTVSIFLNTTPARDTESPVITAAASPSILWPANGSSVRVTVSGTITDAGSGIDPSALAFTVVDEYGIVQPSGRFTVDAQGRYSFTVPLTASRRGNDSNGRTYQIIVRGADRAGNQASASVSVLVPHDRALVGVR